MFRASNQKRFGVFEATYETPLRACFLGGKQTLRDSGLRLHPLSFLVGWTPPDNEIPPRGVSRLRRLTTPLRALRIPGTFASLQYRVSLPLVSCRLYRRKGAYRRIRLKPRFSPLRGSLHFRVAAVPPSGEPCSTLRGVVSRLRLWLAP